MPRALEWLVEAAELLRACSQHFLHDVRVRQVQLDELFALLSAVKHGEVSEAEAIERLERSPQWVWVAMDPKSKLRLAIDVGERTLAMAQRFVHYVTQVLAPDCAPLFLTDGFREYLRRPPARPAPPPPRPSPITYPRLALLSPSSPRGAAQPQYSPACRRSRAPGQHAVQERGWVAAAAGSLPDVPQLLPPAYQLADTLGAAGADERDRGGETLAAPDTGHGGGIDGPCLERT